MSKRTAADSPTGDDDASKRLRNEDAPPFRLRDLPLELREEVYRHFFDDLTRPPRYPYSEWPTKTKGRFAGYISLLGTDKATSSEAKRVFEKEYQKDIVFYFKDGPALHEFQKRSRGIPTLRQASFAFRLEGGPGEACDWLAADSVTLIDGQPGYKCEWSDYPGFFNDALLDCDDEECGIPLFARISREEWVPEDEGFEVKEHEKKQYSNEHFIPYKEVIHPPLQGSIRFKGYYSWRKERARPGAPRRPRKKHFKEAMIMEGKIGDVSFQDYDVSQGRKSLMSHEESIRILRHGVDPQIASFLRSKGPGRFYGVDSSDGESTAGSDEDELEEDESAELDITVFKFNEDEVEEGEDDEASE